MAAFGGPSAPISTVTYHINSLGCAKMITSTNTCQRIVIKSLPADLLESCLTALSTLLSCSQALRLSLRKCTGSPQSFYNGSMQSSFRATRKNSARNCVRRIPAVGQPKATRNCYMPKLATSCRIVCKCPRPFLPPSKFLSSSLVPTSILALKKSNRWCFSSNDRIV